MHSAAVSRASLMGRGHGERSAHSVMRLPPQADLCAAAHGAAPWSCPGPLALTTTSSDGYTACTSDHACLKTQTGKARGPPGTLTARAGLCSMGYQGLQPTTGPCKHGLQRMNTFVYRKGAALLVCHVQMYASAAIGWHGKDRQVTSSRRTLPVCTDWATHLIAVWLHTTPYLPVPAQHRALQPNRARRPPKSTCWPSLRRRRTAGGSGAGRGPPHCRWRATISPAISTLAAQGLGKPADGPSEEVFAAGSQQAMTAIAFTCMPAAAVAARPVAARAARAAVATPAAAAFSARPGTASRRCAASAVMLSVSLLHQHASSDGISAAADQPLPAPCSQAAGAAAWRRPCGVRQLGCTRGVCCRQGNPCWPGAVAAGPGAARAPVTLLAAQPCSARCSRRLRLLPANLHCCPAPLGRSWRTSARRRAPCSGSRCRLAAQPPPTQRQAWEGVQGGGG